MSSFRPPLGALWRLSFGFVMLLGVSLRGALSWASSAVWFALLGSSRAIRGPARAQKGGLRDHTDHSFEPRKGLGEAAKTSVFERALGLEMLFGVGHVA